MGSSVVERVARATRVDVTATELCVELADGRRITVPLSWFPRLESAEAEARTNWKLLGDGEVIHWPAADEDLSVAGLLAGSPSSEMR